MITGESNKKFISLSDRQKMMGTLCRPLLRPLRSMRLSLSTGYHSRYDSKVVIREDLRALYKKLRWYQGTYSPNVLIILRTSPLPT